MMFRKYVGIGYGQFWRGIIFDREFKNLSDLVAQSKKFFYAFDDGAKFYSSATEYKWEWPTGEQLLFRHIKDIEEYDNFHGHEYPFIGWNELTKWPTLEIYDKMMSTNRSSFVPHDGIPPIPLLVFSTTNPSGPGHNAVKRRFIDPAPYGTVIRKSIPVFNPRTQADEIFDITQIAIFGSYRENPYLDAAYIAELTRLTENNPNLYKAWLLGDWEVSSGGAIDDLWEPSIHIVPVFQIPRSWYLDRTFDWGSSRPFSVGFWAVADGSKVQLPYGKTYRGKDFFQPVANSLIRFSEIYGTDNIGSNKGVRWGDDEIAESIKYREMDLMQRRRILTQPFPGAADNQIYDGSRKNIKTIAEVMLDEVGIDWKRSDKSKGSRKSGLQLFRNMLKSSITGRGPGFYVMDVCTSFLDLIPYAPRDTKQPEDIDTDWEDHIWDDTRYRILDHGRSLPDEIPVEYPR